MKKIFLTLVVIFSVLMSNATNRSQLQNKINCEAIQIQQFINPTSVDSISLYKYNPQGSYWKVETINLYNELKFNGFVECFYHYDGTDLYYQDNIIHVIFKGVKGRDLKKELKSYNIPNLSVSELNNAFKYHKNFMYSYCDQLNKRTKNNTIHYLDSIQQINEYNADILGIQLYKEHNTDPKVFEVKTDKNIYLGKDLWWEQSCLLSNGNKLIFVGYSNDTLQYINSYYSDSWHVLNERTFYHVNTIVISIDKIKQLDKRLYYHLTVYSNELDVDDDFDFGKMWYLLDSSYNYEVKQYINSKTNHGFLSYIGFSQNSVGGINPYFKYTNINKKTVKYIKIYFNVLNTVGDKCYNKYENSYIFAITGVGPIATGENAIYNWSNNPATHYTSYDANNIKVTKIEITYMDGSKGSITGNNIIINDF